MGERELILVIAASIFFSTISLSVNKFFIENSEIMWRNEYDYVGISLAQKIIEEAKTRRFDLYEPPSDFTSPTSLGRNPYENYPNFNDVDDFNYFYYSPLNLNVSDTVYQIKVQVYYVSEANINVKVTSRTFYKKLTVWITCPHMSGPVTLSHVYSYIDKD